MDMRSVSAILGWLSCVLSAHVVAQENDPQAEQQTPIENSEFFEVPLKTTITQRFEIYDPHSIDDLRAIQSMGFDQVILDQPHLHAAATELGLDVVLANWWHQDTSTATIDEALAFATQVDPKRLRAISVQDEPERNSPDTPFKYYVDLYQQLKPRMTGPLREVQLEISYWGPLRSWDQRYYEYFSYLYESADTMRLMPYPDLHEDPLGEITLMMHRSHRAMGLAAVEIPEIVILQTWVMPPENKLPTLEELRVMAYQAMLNGAEVVSFFEYDPELWEQTPDFASGFRELMRDLRGLSARWKEAELSSVLHANGVFESQAVWPSGGTATIRINTNREPTDDLLALEIRDSSRAISSTPSTTTLAESSVADSKVIDRGAATQSPQFFGPTTCVTIEQQLHCASAPIIDACQPLRTTAVCGRTKLFPNRLKWNSARLSHAN